MSQLQDTLEQLKQRGEEILEKVKESESYQQLSDRYQSMSPQGQKAVRWGGILLIIFVLVYIPFSQIQVSNEFIATYENKRQLIRDLFKTYRASGSVVQLQPSPSSDSLISMIQTKLQNEQVLPEQILSVSTSSSEGRLIPSNLLQDVIEVKLKQLNLRQIVDIGSRLGQISKTIKMKDLEILADQENEGYFNVTYKVYSLKVPEAPLEAPPEIEVKPKNKKNNTEESQNE